MLQRAPVRILPDPRGKPAGCSRGDCCSLPPSNRLRVRAPAHQRPDPTQPAGLLGRQVAGAPLDNFDDTHSQVEHLDECPTGHQFCLVRGCSPGRESDLHLDRQLGGQSAVGATLVASAAYRAQRELVGRLGIDDEAIAALVDALATAPDRRLSASRAASVTGVPANRVPLVMSQVAKLLNVEGYPMVSSDPATQAVTLDAELLAEQYGVQVRLC